MMRRFFRNFSALFCIVCLLTVAFSASAASSLPPSLDKINTALVYNIEHDVVILEKNADTVVYPASATKLVTALVAYEALQNDLYTKVEVTSAMAKSFHGRCLGLITGEQITVESLFAALLVGGYNDAAVVLACAAYGSEASFAGEMNRYCASIGTKMSHFTNASGLHDYAMVTTANDMALIAKEIIGNDFLFSLTKKPKYTIPASNVSGEYTIYTRNHLISSIVEEGYYYPHAAGLNVGSTEEGGNCVVTSGSYDDLTYLCILLGGCSTDGTVSETLVTARECLRYALGNFSVRIVKSKKDTFAPLPVLYSATVTEVGLRMTNDLTALLRDDTDIASEVSIRTEMFFETLEAPFAEGTVVGTVKAYDKAGNLLSSSDLITADGADAHGFLRAMAAMKDFVRSKTFIVLFIVLLLIISLVVYFIIGTRKRRSRHPLRRRRLPRYRR